MSEDFVWFVEHYDELKNKYGNSYIVIKNKEILGIYETYADGVNNTLKNEELGTFIVQECNLEYESYYCSIASMNFM